ncbi:MAG: AMP-binding protein, partial [Gammaproteobacteria bacterium]|nr:AMP-binding protein [Gammaproteobacteria bacterium]
MSSMWYPSPLPDLNIPAVPLTGFVLNKAASQPDAVAMVNADTGESVTFAQLSAAIHELAGGLQQRGFGKGSVLALIAPNSPQYAIVFHAVAVCGGTVTTV